MTASRTIPINKPSITSLEVDFVNDAATNGWGEKCYDYIYRFQKDFAQFQGSSFGLATSSCTGAIHLGLMALGVKAGDEVILPEISWIASVEPVLYIGAKPVFADVQQDTWCLDPAAVKEAVTPRTKAIIPVHIYGNMCDMDQIMSIAAENNLVVLEDAAEALGSEYKGRKAGSIGHAGVFSFHGTKTITTGEGGMLVTNDASVMHRAKVLNDHGRDATDPENKMFWMRDYGYKYKMSNLQAALGCAQMERINELLKKKREIFGWYRSLLKGMPCQLNPEPAGTVNTYWLPTVVFDHESGFNREIFFAQCRENGVDCRPFFYPLSSLPMFETNKANHTAFDISPRAINLPSFHDMTHDDARFVVGLLSAHLNG